ncbi:MAG: hypothetical protein OPY06_05075 [Nitrosopumilus sp.]|nr:hypothetical protein [Nitrosopumilus sp.]MDF2428411.1 hypothetical protein [Nitrosopumilus sp.]MDF2429883.1 hypothetical protein [Nitrosopumilus sp.]
MNTLLKSNIPLESYGKPLAPSHIAFLVREEHRGQGNTSQTRKDIMRNVQGSLRQVHQIMKYTKNLKESEISETFNAQNLEELFENLLKDIHYNSISETIPKKYDVRTSEIARVMVATGLKYLTQSEKFKDNKSTIENSESINDDFENLTRTLFNEEFGILKKYDELGKAQMKIVGSIEWENMNKKIEELERNSPISINDPINPEQEPTLQKDRKYVLDELFVIYNKIEFKEIDVSEKKQLLKQQNEYRQQLDAIDKTLKALEGKEMLQHLQTLYLLSVHKEIESVLSKQHPTKLTHMIRKSINFLKFLKGND